MDSAVGNTVTASGANGSQNGNSIQVNPNDADSSLTQAQSGVRYHHHFAFHRPLPQQQPQQLTNEADIYVCDKAIQTSRDAAAFSDSVASDTPAHQSSHHCSPPSYVYPARQLAEPSPNSANAARALSSLFHQCRPLQQEAPPHATHHHQYHPLPQNYHHHSPYTPRTIPPSPWGGPPPPRYPYPTPQQNDRSPSWHHRSPYSSAINSSQRVTQGSLNSSYQGSSASSMTSESGSFESSYELRETTSESCHQPVAPSYYTRFRCPDTYPRMYPYGSNPGAGDRYSPVASQPKRLLCNFYEDARDESKQSNHASLPGPHLVTPTPKKMKPNEILNAPILSNEDSYSRKSKSLGLLCENFCKRDWSSGIIGIDDAAKLLGVERRRIYDIINILESLDVVRRKCKNRYEWLGFGRLPHVMAGIQREGICGSRELADEARRFGVIGTDETVERIMETGPTKKSLGRLSRQYLQLFLVGNQVMSLTDASDRIMGKAEEPDDIDDPVERKAAVTKGQKTKIRRLYDIANVLASIGLVQKADGERRTRPTFSWVYHWSPRQIRELLVSGDVSTSVVKQEKSMSPCDDKTTSVLAHIHEHGARECLSSSPSAALERSEI